ncbi:flagellar biosynthesis protein FlgA [Clostridium sp. AM58-1XD]|uniref:flagellar biosynthesis protein FlgA n=1 Tax=Clostridium sp. AM58-1XD TaxID=2292307 RepID=UPI000E4DE5A9|nr:flagellar biosynthesis protein FlgA [Clostridium sp. AM58-1XD]RGY98881.1 flagellar biosynthesis protein FlgA [Clostridium sp. AM58-1XD]
MIYHHLYNKFRKKDCVNVGIIGTGAYGTAIVTQGIRTPFLNVCVIADIRLENAKKAYERAGIPASRQIYCNSAEEAEKALSDGMYVYTDQSSLPACIASLDIICESTGNPEQSAGNILDAIERGKHVAVITKDCDACIGPILKKKADEKGVVYTPVDGDQHGLLIQMYEWAKSIGLHVLCGGKATDGEFIYDKEAGTVSIKTDKTVAPPFSASVKLSEDDRKYFEKIPAGHVKEYIEARKAALDRLPHPGAYDLCEMTIAGNYTGLTPQVETLIHAPMRISEIPDVYIGTDHGGLLEHEDTLDLVTCMHEPADAGLGGGVFLVVRSDSEYSNEILATKGQIASYDKHATVIYRPYHLCGVETPCTLLLAGLLGINTASDHYLPRFQLAKVADENIEAGATFGGDHSTSMRAVIRPYMPVAPGNYAEGHLLFGNRARVRIPKGTLITYDMVEEPENSLLWRLRREQDAYFA